MIQPSVTFHNILLRTRTVYAHLLHNKWFLLFLLVLSSASCKKVVEETGLVGICPEVVSTIPLNAATGVLLNTKVEATFNEAMDPATINTLTFTLMNGTTPIAGVVSYSGLKATFTPSSNLAPNTLYSATVTNGVKDPAGNAMINNYLWSFTTGPGPDIIAPTVTDTDPARAAVGVALNKKVSATFSEVMDSLSATKSFTLVNTTLGGSDINGTVTYSGTTAVFTPANNLLPNTTYTGTISTVAKDPAGNTLAANYNWSFTTGSAPDVTPPTVVATFPNNGATGVAFNVKLAATFSEAMDPATINTTSFILKQGTNAISGTVTYTGLTATFTPAANLAPNTTYTATITTGSKDLAGNALVSDYVWTFTTGAALDATRPTVISTDPANGATGVLLAKKPTATFSEPMDPATMTTSTFTVKNGTTAVPGTVSYSGTTATFSPSANFAPNTTYTATITTGAKDLAGNALASDFVWMFTTGPLADVTPPIVISTDPANNATGVVVSKRITASFSESMDPLTINTNTFTVRNGTIAVAGTVTYSGTTATFTPSVLLSPATVYTATITTGAKDLAGNALAANHVWSFTTEQLPSNAPALGSIAMFGAFGGNAGITNQGINTVINNGSIGTTAASTLITGFHDGTTGDVYTETPLNKGNVTGRIYTAPPPPGTASSFAIATQGLADAFTAYNSISPASKPGGSDPGAGELGGLTLAPGVYKSAGATFQITNGNLTLDGKGDPNAVWIFQTAAGLTVGVAGPSGARSVNLINGAQAKNVFWYVGSAAVINAAGGGVMVGTIIASSGITFSTAGNAAQTVLNGRAISLVASVTMVNTTINVQ